MKRDKKMIEVIISTMFMDNYSDLLKKMNIQSDAIIINQCNEEKIEYEKYENYNILIVNTKDRGLSKSRNCGVKYSSAKYLIFADDDFKYSDGYADKVLNAYSSHNDADAIVFGAIRNDGKIYKVFKNNKLKGRAKYNINSIRISVKRENIIKKGILFDERFGTGAEIANGEDTIFVCDMFKNRMSIYSDNFILCSGIKNDRKSTWWHGYNEKFFIDRGLVYKRISHFNILLSLYFAIKKHKEYKNDVTFLSALNKMVFHR